MIGLPASLDLVLSVDLERIFAEYAREKLLSVEVRLTAKLYFFFKERLRKASQKSRLKNV